MTEHPFIELRTLSPAGKSTMWATGLGILRHLPRPSRPVAWAVLAIVFVGIAGFLAWQYLASPVTVPVAAWTSNVREQVFGLGTVGSRVQSNVGFKVAGVLIALKADQGDHVRAGQVLAQLDARDIEAQLAVTRAGIAQARASIDNAKANVASASATLANARAMSARRTALLREGATSSEDAQTSEAAARVASATVASAESAVTLAEAALQSAEAQARFQQTTLAYYTLYAPYDAWIVSRNLELGSTFNPAQSASNQSVFALVPANTIWMVAYVDERLAGQLRIGQPADIVLRSNPAKRIPGHVARIEIRSDSVNEERLVDIAFDHIPANIHLAEQAEVVITTATLPHAVAVPESAIIGLQGGRGTVWTVENGRLAQRQVTFGQQLLDGRLPILEGLPAGAAAVSATVSGLRIGRAARIAETPRP
jgi:HlyD family secretion protein